MESLEYVIALLDADPFGWSIFDSNGSLCHKKGNVYIIISGFDNNRYEIKGCIYMELGFFQKRKVKKAIEIRHSAILAQKFLDTCIDI